MYTGFAIALAWPQTYCKQSGAWYDGIMNILGLSQNHYYKVGHAAVVLVEAKTGVCYYFDFGRYHAPFGHGRVRDQQTDHELKMASKARVSDEGYIENFEEILVELSSNTACHGVGPLYGSYCKIVFEKAFAMAKQMQENSPLKYGPFVWTATNCSRFVRTIVLSGNPAIVNKIRIGVPLTISPTPIGNVCSLNKRKIYKGFQMPNAECEKDDLYSADKRLKLTLEAPPIPGFIPRNSHWLAGEGAGSWFHIKENKKLLFEITRYSADGKTESSGGFQIKNNHALDLNKDYEFTHISHCKSVNIRQGKSIVHLERTI